MGRVFIVNCSNSCSTLSIILFAANITIYFSIFWTFENFHFWLLWFSNTFIEFVRVSVIFDTNKSNIHYFIVNNNRFLSIYFKLDIDNKKKRAFLDILDIRNHTIKSQFHVLSNDTLTEIFLTSFIIVDHSVW